MKGAGWLGIVMIALGALMIWAGFNGVKLVDVIGSILRGEPLDALESTRGSRGESGFDEDAGAGDGGGGGGGGGW